MTRKEFNKAYRVWADMVWTSTKYGTGGANLSDGIVGEAMAHFRKRKSYNLDEVYKKVIEIKQSQREVEK